MTPTPEIELSVVIPSHNRRELLRRCLDALARQTQPSDTFEVVVADDGSTDGTGDMLERLSTPFRLRVLRLEKCGKPAARNAGVEIATGDVCLFLDDDVIASPELVSEHLAAHRTDERIIGIGALTQAPPKARDWYAEEFTRAWNEHYERLKIDLPGWSDCYGANVSVVRTELIGVGGFAEDFPTAQDTELAFRLHCHGCVPTYIPRAHGVHDDQKRRGRMLADARRIGADSLRFVERHPDTLSKRLGGFNRPRHRDVALRRVLLALRIPPLFLAAPGRLIPRENWRHAWFYFVSRYTFWLGVRENMKRRQWLQITRGVAVLMYHAFRNGGEPDRYIVPRRSFAWQMRVLAALRYRVIGLEELARALRESKLPPHRSVVVTIDDGYADNLTIAQPILRRRRFPATIFLVSRRLGGSNDWSTKSKVAGRPLLSLDQIGQLKGNGIAFGAHTRTHCSLPDMPDDAVAGEIEGSRQDLERVLGTRVETFAYPYGRLDERAVAATGQAGFLGACTVDPRLAGLGDEPLLIPRIEVRGSDSIGRFLRKLWFGGS